MVGYFALTDPALADFEAAAQEHLGDIPFYVAHDPIVSENQVKLSNQYIHL